MNILGVNITHDRAAALIKDGHVISYVAEERLDRHKHSFGKTLPLKAIAYVLAEANLDMDELDVVGISGAGLTKTDLRRLISTDFKEILGNVPVEVVGHHDSHAATAFFCSPYRDAAIWIADGGGEADENYAQESESYYIGSELNISHLYTRFQPPLLKAMIDEGFSVSEQDFSKALSLGRKYEQITYLLGFKFGQAGKTMGLSAYGTNKFRWRPPARMLGRFEPDINVGTMIDKVLQLSNDAIQTNSADLAAEIQSLVEDQAMLCLEQLFQETGTHNLCIAGGIGLNCVLNTRIAKESNFSSVFIFPAAGDDGQAIGNALHAYIKWGGTNRYPLHTASLGRKYSEAEIMSALNDMNTSYTRFEQVETVAAKLIAEGRIVAWFQGGSECGPRALGFRSILADPRNPSMKEILNSRVKHREWFRPYAPVTLQNYAPTYFSVPESPSLPFMLLAADVKPNVRHLIPAVVHSDGSARVQIINHEHNTRLSNLIEAFGHITGVPILLNTSFNVANEPIVESPLDAIRCFQSTDIDYLILGDFVLNKKLS